VTPSNPASNLSMAKSPKAPAPKPDPQTEVVGLRPPRLDASAAQALARAQDKLGHPVPPIVAASLVDDQAEAPPPAQSTQPPAGDDADAAQ